MTLNELVLRSLWLLILTGLLNACGSVREPADGKPLYELTPGQVVEPLPRAEPVLTAGNSSPYSVNGETYWVMDSNQGYRESGVASWYGRKFHGRNTANGEVFNAYRATAAHRSLPIPSYVRVTNLENGRSMIVRVNDRGPFHSDRIIDLSYAAAVKLGFEHQGTARVEVKALTVEGSEDLRPVAGAAASQGRNWSSDYRYIQVGAFSEERSAKALRERLRLQMEAPIAVTEIMLGDSPFYRVRVGPVENRSELLDLHDQLLQLGYLEVRMMPE